MLEEFNCGSNDLNLLSAQVASFSRVRIEPGHSNTRNLQTSPSKKIRQKHPDPYDLLFRQSERTSRRGTCAVTRATVILPPVRHIAKFSMPAQEAKNSVWPGKSKPISCIDFFEMGPVTTPCKSPERHRSAASSNAASACNAESRLGRPGVKFSLPLPTDQNILGILRDIWRHQGRAYNLRTNPCRIAQGETDARLHSLGEDFDVGLLAERIEPTFLGFHALLLDEISLISSRTSEIGLTVAFFLASIIRI